MSSISFFVMVFAVVILATAGCIVVSPAPHSLPTAISLPTATPEPTEIPETWGRFYPWPMDGTCYRLENSLCVGVKSVDWNAPARMPEVTEVGDSRLFGLTERPPTGSNFVVIELYLFNSGITEISTKAIWWSEAFGLAKGGQGVEVMGQRTNTRILNLNVNVNPLTGEQDGCIILDDPDIPETWVEDGGWNVYIPPGENLRWKPCFVVPEADLSTLVLKWPHFVEGPAV